MKIDFFLLNRQKFFITAIGSKLLKTSIGFYDINYYLLMRLGQYLGTYQLSDAAGQKTMTTRDLHRFF